MFEKKNSKFPLSFLLKMFFSFFDNIISHSLPAGFIFISAVPKTPTVNGSKFMWFLVNFQRVSI